MKFAPSPTRRAAAASLALAAVLATGCSAVNYQATTHVYSGSDGVMFDAEGVKVRHLTFIANEEGGPARLVGVVSNNSAEDAQVEISAAGDTFPFSLSSGEAINLQNDDELIVSSIQAAPGAMQDVTISINGTEETVGASVLDGGIAEYRALLPDGFDESTVEHLEHGPDTYGGGAAHHDPDAAHH